MDADKIKAYLEGLKGKSISIFGSEPELEQLGGDFHEEVIGKLKEANFVIQGRNKQCSFVDKYNFHCAILKSKMTYSEPSIQYNQLQFDDWIYINTMFRMEGALIPKLYTLFYADKHFIEIQERVKGSPIAYSNRPHLHTKVLGRNFEDLTQAQVEQVREELFNYNVTQQQKLIALDNKHFEKLLETLMMFAKHNFLFGDAHAGNVLLSDNGFMLIDIDYDDILYQQRSRYAENKPVTEAEICAAFINPFLTSTYEMFMRYLTKEQIAVIRQNNVEIFKKLTDVMSAKGMLLDFNIYTFNPGSIKLGTEYIEALGEENYVKNYKYICESQIKLRQKMGLAPNLYFDELEKQHHKNAKK